MTLSNVCDIGVSSKNSLDQRRRESARAKQTFSHPEAGLRLIDASYATAALDQRPAMASASDRMRSTSAPGATRIRPRHSFSQGNSRAP